MKIRRRRYLRISLFFTRLLLSLLWWEIILGQFLASGLVRHGAMERRRRWAVRFRDLAVEMGIAADAMGVVINRAHGLEGLERARDLFADTPVEILGVLPEDEELRQRDARGEPVSGLRAENPIYQAAGDLFGRLTADN